MENATQMPPLTKTILRVALIALAALMAPAVASRVVAGWNWPPMAFVFVYALFFATGMAYALIAGKMNFWSYKAGVGLALATGFVLGWFDRVQVADSGHPANLAYYSVLILGIIGVTLSRLQPRGLARTLFTMAAATALIAVTLPVVVPSRLTRNMAISHGVYAALFLASGLLIRHASLAESQPHRDHRELQSS